MGHAKVITTLSVDAHLHSGGGAMKAGPLHAENVVPLWG